MVVNPFWFGVFTTLAIEAIALLLAAIIATWRNKK